MITQVRRKYRNLKEVVDGITFASRREARRYRELTLLARAGEITKLTLQPTYEFTVVGPRGDHVPLLRRDGQPFRYQADFSYFDCRLGRTVVEDVKGIRTRVYGIKRALMKSCHGIDIVEV